MISSFNKLNQIFISHIRSLSTSFNLPIHEFNPDPSTPIENQLLDLGHQRRLERENKPYRSSFRVYSIFEVKTNDDKRWLIEGANSEPAYIGFNFLIYFLKTCFWIGFSGGSICAERNALGLLSHFPSHLNPIIVRGSCVTDSSDPLTPGLLCLFL